MTAAGTDDFVVVGYVRRAHGVRGEVSVEPISDVPERFSVGSKVSLTDRERHRRELEVATVRSHHDQLLIRFGGIEGREEADLLRGATLEVEANAVPPAPDGTFYHYQLVGCRCHDAEQGDLGEVEEVIEDGGGLLLAVTSSDGTLLVPFVDDYLVRIDIEERTIDLELPPGLLELCVSPS